MLPDVISLMANYYAHYNFPDTPFFLRGDDQLYSYFSKTLDDKEKKKFTYFQYILYAHCIVILLLLMI